MSSWEYEDYYDEPNEFEQQIEDFKASLVSAVKREHRDKMDQLEKENDELQDVKKNWKSLENEYKSKIRELELKIETADRDAKKLRLKDFMEELKQYLWQVESHWVYGTKCDKCDDNRRVHFLSPSGKDITEDCTCAEGVRKYSPVEYELYSFKQNNYYNDKNTIGKWYKKKYSDEDYFSEDSTHVALLVSTKDNFSSVGDRLYNVFFISKEICQEYCDLKNKENRVTEDMTTDKCSNRLQRAAKK